MLPKEMNDKMYQCDEKMLKENECIYLEKLINVELNKLFEI